ncbi:MAG: hypothetical protein ACLPVI_11230 [Dehalococcoidales bacterium]
MGEFNPDKIERANFQDEPSQELIEALSERRKIVARNLEVYWKYEIPCTGENGNDFATDR